MIVEPPLAFYQILTPVKHPLLPTDKEKTAIKPIPLLQPGKVMPIPGRAYGRRTENGRLFPSGDAKRESPAGYFPERETTIHRSIENLPGPAIDINIKTTR